MFLYLPLPLFQNNDNDNKKEELQEKKTLFFCSTVAVIRNSSLDVFLGKGVLKRCSKPAGERNLVRFPEQYVLSCL